MKKINQKIEQLFFTLNTAVFILLMSTECTNKSISSSHEFC
jgi:hypothetical protein